MAKYSTDLIRNPRQIVLRDALRGCTLRYCKGTPPATLVAPATSSILSSHTISATAGFVTSGKLTLSGSDIGDDSSADSSGTITHAIIEKSGVGPIVMFKVPTELSVTINSSASLEITQSTVVQASLFEVLEGNK